MSTGIFEFYGCYACLIGKCSDLILKLLLSFTGFVFALAEGNFDFFSHFRLGALHMVGALLLKFFSRYEEFFSFSTQLLFARDDECVFALARFEGSDAPLEFLNLALGSLACGASCIAGFERLSTLGNFGELSREIAFLLDESIPLRCKCADL